MISILRGNALALPLADQSVDLIVTSPPYFGLRSYTDGGEHYAGQIGDEPTPAEFVDALIAATAEMMRVVKPSGSIWVNLGDKYAGGGGFAPDAPSNQPGGSGVAASRPRSRTETSRATSGGKSWGHRPKTLVGIPWRYAIRCIDDLGLILRAEVIWSKPNGLPESVTDRVRRSHEQWFHFVLNPRYYSAVDEVREGYASGTAARYAYGFKPASAVAAGQSGNGPTRADGGGPGATNPLGKLPGSVWTDDGMSVSQSRIGLVLEAVSEGHLTPEEGERILWAQRDQASWPTSTGPASAGNGADGETPADMARRATSRLDARIGRTESLTDCGVDPLATDSPSTTSAATSGASTRATSSSSPSQRTSDERTPSEMGAHADTHWPTPTAKSPGTAGSPSAARSATRTGRSDAGESVWVVPTEPLHVPESLGIDHFAAFPTEFPRRIIQGWSPRGICVECGEGRRPTSERDPIDPRFLASNKRGDGRGNVEVRGVSQSSILRTGLQAGQSPATRITGEACACPEPTAPTRPGTVLDPFGGTGTTALVAHALGRHGISNDMSADYCRLAGWRTTDPKQLAKAARREFKPAAEQTDGQLDLLEGIA